MKKTFFSFVVLFSMLVLSACSGQSNTESTGDDDLELRKSVHLSVCYARHLIANDSIQEGIHLLDSLWNNYHVNWNTPCLIGMAYYRMGDRETAMRWFEYNRKYIDSLISVNPSEKLYSDLVPLVYILDGIDEAMKLRPHFTGAYAEMADSFFSYTRREFTDAEQFLQKTIKDDDYTYKPVDYIR